MVKRQLFLDHKVDVLGVVMNAVSGGGGGWKSGGEGLESSVVGLAAGASLMTGLWGSLGCLHETPKGRCGERQGPKEPGREKPGSDTCASSALQRRQQTGLQARGAARSLDVAQAYLAASISC